MSAGGTTGGPTSAPVTVTVHAEPPTVTEGGVVLATVRARATRDVVLQGGSATLTCATAYRYTTGGAYGTSYSSTARRSDDLASQPLPGPTFLRAGRESEEQVLLVVPPTGPPTTACDLVTIAWTVGATVRFEGSGRAVAAPVDLTVLGGGAGAEITGSTVVDRGRFGSIAFEDMSGRTIAPGSTLSGCVVVRPRRAGAVGALRVELVLAQVVPHGPMIGDDPSRNPYIAEKESETVVARVALTAPVDVGGGLLRAPFVLSVPTSLPAPTLVTPDFSLRWVLRAVVGRRGAWLPRTTSADVELAGSTIPRAR